MIDVLVIGGDRWHSIEIVRRGLSPLAGDEFRFDFVENAKDILSPEMIREYQVIMICKQDIATSANYEHAWFDDVAEVTVAELKKYVDEGHGLMTVHAGTTFKTEKTPEFTEFVGNTFLTHPPRCDMHVEIVAGHPVTKGVEDFDIRDEHYQLDITAKDIDVLFKTSSQPGGNHIGGYAKTYGKGRICVMTPGHILSVWQHPQYRKLLSNAIKWSANK
jgi:type 1 glutamine amidotransferase